MVEAPSRRFPLRHEAGSRVYHGVVRGLLTGAIEARKAWQLNQPESEDSGRGHMCRLVPNSSWTAGG